MNPQMNRKGTATATGGKVAQNSLVTRWLVNGGTSGACGGFVKSRSAVGQTNMYRAASSGTNTSGRDRNGFGVTPSFFISQAQKSWRARTWQPQPQTKRAKMGVARTARVKKMNPALMNPFRRVYMVSEGSMGEIVRPMKRHWMTWAIISRFSEMRAAARRRLAFDLRMAPFGTGGGSPSTGRRTVRRGFTSWVPQPLFMDSVYLH